MIKIAKNSELADTSHKASLCGEPREALIEIASWKYDDHLLQLTKIYFADVYKNTNGISLDGKQIREKFLDDFDFRKSLIVFGQEKWLWMDNREVRKAMTHRMNFEWENVDDMKKEYSSQIKKMFFEKGKTEAEDMIEAEDPILSLLKDEDKKKVILSKKYWGDIKTFTKLSTILSFSDSEQQKNIIEYLVPDDLQINIPLAWRKEIIDITWVNSLYNILHRRVNKSSANQHWEREKKDEMEKNIITYITTKQFAKDIPHKTMIDIINQIWKLYYRSSSDAKNFAKFLIEFLEWIEIQKLSINKDVIEVFECCMLFFWENHPSVFHLRNDKIDLAIIEEQRKGRRHIDYEIRSWIEYLKQCMQIWKNNEKES